jgi:hypothetical protein
LEVHPGRDYSAIFFLLIILLARRNLQIRYERMLSMDNSQLSDLSFQKNALKFLLFWTWTCKASLHFEQVLGEKEAYESEFTLFYYNH